ncbi:semaphorin-7A-like isoform X2, partial [Clarias magur]
MLDNLKLVHDPYSENIYAGGPHGLYMLNPGEHPALKEVYIPIFEPECQSISSGCGYTVSLLKEGRNGNPLFMCGNRDKNTECCDVDSEHIATGCFKLTNPTQITQPSLHLGDSLYYTVSTGNSGQPGIYRSIEGKFTWPPTSTTEQRYVTILGNQSGEPLDGKVYSFYTEQNQNQDPDTPLWIPRVSQICTADRGGSKSILQYRWTSMLTARLFCGDEKEHLLYTELLDVAVLEDEEWKNTTIYGLFKNAYTLRAVCVYKMSEIITVFASNDVKDNTETFSSPRPGECVENSQMLSPSMLKFMESLPEMSQWIKPAQDPLLFDHNVYTHLQVDRVESSTSENSHHDVLFMALENGNIHKILVQDGDPFIIAEYKPFQSRTHISSMLLDHNTKKLFVSSSSELIQIDLHNCSVYGKHCDSCVMARDPYCGWDLETCSANNGSLIQDVTHGNHCLCENDGAFLSFSTLSACMLDNLKLVHDSYSHNIYAGGPHGLYMLNPGEHPALKEVYVPIFEQESQINSACCGYKISLLKEGRNGNPLFMCGTRRENTKCCDVDSEHNAMNCFKLKSSTEITEPSLHIGDSLYYTVSNRCSDHLYAGLYRSNMSRFTLPPQRITEQRYITILGNQGSGPLDGKVYSLYTEQNQNQDLDMPIWISRVSQICTADRGGSKRVLQYRWTSMLTTRLFCGDEEKGLAFTELLDVAVLEVAKWESSIIYGLFKNAYNLRAVCVYKMSDIINVFASSDIKDNTETFSSPRPGECVANSQTLSPNFLEFMGKHPEMNQWIKPARAPLLFMHHHYTHLQVDRVESTKSENSHHDVLFMAL